MMNGDYIKLELYPNIAPITVENFVKLCNEHFYDGIIFHRVISGFMIQGGDPDGTGMGGSATTIKGEFLANGVQNGLSHERGVISMARRGNDNNSASSQFFIVHETSQRNKMSLDGNYAAFGKVIEGIETVDRIAAIATDGNDRPLAEQKMKTIRVITEEQAKAAGPAPEA
ncbi:MAG: peptidylprolyl isomerase [Clostridia bacterium]|nr:peptidylprolyl isomerase [Clostridia bacterium]